MDARMRHAKGAGFPIGKCTDCTVSSVSDGNYELDALGFLVLAWRDFEF